MTCTQTLNYCTLIQETFKSAFVKTGFSQVRLGSWFKDFAILMFNNFSIMFDSGVYVNCYLFLIINKYFVV